MMESPYEKIGFDPRLKANLIAKSAENTSPTFTTTEFNFEEQAARTLPFSSLTTADAIEKFNLTATSKLGLREPGGGGFQIPSL
ncbi:hypothetical protein SLA2020_267760 [Shorea laevis]